MIPNMIPKRNYYLNDYFDLFDNQYNKEKEYMKTDIKHPKIS